MKLVLVLVGFLMIILACGAETSTIVGGAPGRANTGDKMHRYNSADSHAYPSGHRGDDCSDCHTHAVLDTRAYYDAGTNPEGYRGGHSGPDHHSRTDGDPGANGYRCPYCNSYSYASAVNTYSHAATLGE